MMNKEDTKVIKKEISLCPIRKSDFCPKNRTFPKAVSDQQ